MQASNHNGTQKRLGALSHAETAWRLVAFLVVLTQLALAAWTVALVTSALSTPRCAYYAQGSETYVSCR